MRCAERTEETVREGGTGERGMWKSEFIHSAVGLRGDISTESWSPACSQASSRRPRMCYSNYTAAPETNNGTLFFCLSPPAPSCHKYHLCHAMLDSLWKTKWPLNNLKCLFVIFTPVQMSTEALKTFFNFLHTSKNIFFCFKAFNVF